MEFKPCPFCGKEVNIEDPDVLYPNGIAWMDDPVLIRTYHNARALPPSQWCYSMHCPVQAGGCGVEMPGDTRQEAIDNWNRRAT